MTRPMNDRFAPRDQQNPNGVLFRDFTVQVERSDDDAPITIAISSEAPVERYDWWEGERYVEVLDHSVGGPDLSYARDGLPFCLDHDLRKQIGLLENVRVDRDGMIRGELRPGNHPDAAWVLADMRAGVRKKVSIGYWPGEQYTQTKADPDTVPTRRYTGWMLYEASSVAVPADYEVGVGRDARGVTPTASNPPAAGAEPHTTERQMDEHENATTRGSAPVERAPQTAAELAELAQRHGATDRLAAWITRGMTVEQAKDELLAARTQQSEETRSVGTAARPEVVVGAERETEKPWGSLTEFMAAARNVAVRGVTDPRLHATRGIATGMGIGQDSDGGFLIPEQFAQGIVTRAFEGGRILSRLNRVPVSGNQYHVALVDETSRANGSRFGGIQGYWIGENDSPTATKPKVRRATLDITKKVGVLAYVSEEQLEDAPATDAMLTQGLTEEVTFTVEAALWEGNGVGKPLGIMTSGALVTVAKESGQTADTVVAGNALKMNARLWSRSHQSAAWFINQQVLAQLPAMTIGNQPVYLPPTGLVGSSPFGTLLGKPIEVVEYASQVGDLGDIVLADWGQYLFGDKARNQIARSMHVRFVQGEEAFRLVYRCDGLPMWNAPLTPFKGSDTVSPFITLAARD